MTTNLPFKVMDQQQIATGCLILSTETMKVTDLRARCGSNQSWVAVVNKKNRPGATCYNPLHSKVEESGALKGSAEQIFRVRDKIALVTGGYSGIGAAVSLGLADMGAKVAVAGNEGDKAAAWAKTLQSRGLEAFSATFDVLSAVETHRMVDAVVDHFGRLDILVNSVGVNREQRAEDVTEDVFDHVVGVNLKGAMFQAQAAAKHMIRQGSGGRQVHIGSVRTQLALRDRGYAAYCATKGGLGTLCKQLAAEWAPHGINVNIVAPTFVNTEMSAHMLADEDFHRALVSRIPLGRIAEPEDVMRAVLFFASPASDFITGQILYVDGGITATQ
jgi:NAD(P)-dependent dehydrogenase (short-subunit alcohol dehydrogenase family)